VRAPRITRRAISPRFATSSVLITGSPRGCEVPGVWRQRCRIA